MEAFLDKSGRKTEKHSANHTLAAGDSGIVHVVTATGTTQTLPATANAATFTVQVAESGIGVRLSPNSDDMLIGLGFTAADDKDAILPADKARAGDFITVVGNGGTGYVIVDASGAWERE